MITTGGVSVGDRDHVRAALAATGVELELWKVAMKPGKPFSFGMNGRVPVFGLPGNPVSGLVGFLLLVRPALRRLSGEAPAAARPVGLDLPGMRRPPLRRSRAKTHSRRFF